MERAFISLGSNLGDRWLFLRRALGHVEKIDRTSVQAISSVYETEPVGVKEQADFLNAVAELMSDLPPKKLLERLKAIEKLLGRTQTQRWGPREIDIDLIYYGNTVLNDDDCSIPHAEVHKRKFILVPLAEIDKHFIDPSRRCTIGELLARCSDTSRVFKTGFLFSPVLKEH